jgi:hypothetical protein
MELSVPIFSTGLWIFLTIFARFLALPRVILGCSHVFPPRPRATVLHATHSPGSLVAYHRRRSSNVYVRMLPLYALHRPNRVGRPSGLRHYFSSQASQAACRTRGLSLLSNRVRARELLRHRELVTSLDAGLKGCYREGTWCFRGYPKRQSDLTRASDPTRSGGVLTAKRNRLFDIAPPNLSADSPSVSQLSRSLASSCACFVAQVAEHSIRDEFSSLIYRIGSALLTLAEGSAARSSWASSRWTRDQRRELRFVAFGAAGSA